ncbi:MAG: hypothetical protein HC892_01515 [Saprospiraceae bacterium]|nr:hypothetical protein [Saprospiraceae bacterium]
MINPNYKQHVTAEFTNNTCTIQGVEGYLQVAIKNKLTSTGIVSVRGSLSKTIGGIAETAITLSAGESLSLGDENDIVSLNEITIVADALSVAQIVGIKHLKNF